MGLGIEIERWVGDGIGIVMIHERDSISGTGTTVEGTVKMTDAGMIVGIQNQEDQGRGTVIGLRGGKRGIGIGVAMGVGMMRGDEVVVGIEVGVGVDHREDGGIGRNGIDGDEEAMKGRGCPMMGDDHMALVDSLSHFDATFCSRGRFFGLDEGPKRYTWKEVRCGSGQSTVAFDGGPPTLSAVRSVVAGFYGSWWTVYWDFDSMVTVVKCGQSRARCSFKRVNKTCFTMNIDVKLTLDIIDFASPADPNHVMSSSSPKSR